MGVSRPRSRELAPSQADWLELASFLAAASRRLPGHDLASARLLRSFDSTLREGAFHVFPHGFPRSFPRSAVSSAVVPQRRREAEQRAPRIRVRV